MENCCWKNKGSRNSFVANLGTGERSEGTGMIGHKKWTRTFLTEMGIPHIATVQREC